ncbi:MAG: 2,3-bisphosphoglycerate-independent phosphoglycerate mutase [Gammaproteobacteria bacterium]|nr:2,3-bisphosphoglycerate-independent phosphoglycerate mutase [Gammaproteobacteria bacterium]
MANQHRPVVLIILDGWGYSESPVHNAILSARKPIWDRVWQAHPHTLLRASEAAVGLPSGQMGNSEVGHLNLGAGRVVYQEFTRVTLAIKDGSFFTNRSLTDAVDQAIANDKAVHIMGLLSPGGVHSHEEHIQAMIELAVKRGASKVYLHAFLDGRDTPPKSATDSILATEATFKRVGGGRFASVIGRYYAMDRDHRWPRIKAAYDLITTGVGDYVAPDAASALAAAYERGESDEFVKATAIVPHGTAPVTVQDGDAIIFMNFRSDRARQITRPFIEPTFNAFERTQVPQISTFVSLTEYSEDFESQVAFPAARLSNVFGSYIAGMGLHQLRIAETEKYAHVTFFFNGGEEQPFFGEDRILVNSPNVATYDLQPEMSAYEVTDKLVAAIEGGAYDTIICNYANPDMVGHTGNLAATVKAIEALDTCLGRVLTALEKVGGEALITADHGNAEMMRSEDDSQAHTAHTINMVPFVYVGRAARMAATGALCDVAPTMLYLMGLPIPSEMNGRPLLELTDTHA